MKRGILLVALALLIASAAGAHIGSPNVFYEGDAGPYKVRVIIKTPGVVPGLAEITVRVEDKVDRVAARPIHWDAGLEGAPPADVAKPVRGDLSLYTTELWLMTAGSYSVYVEVEGEKGAGTAIVPVQSLATERLGMYPWLGALLAGLGILLVAGLVRLAGAAVESTLEPGRQLEGKLRTRARWSMAGAFLVVGLILYGGKTWWDNVDAGYLSKMWQALDVESSVRVAEGGWRVVELDLVDDQWDRMTPIAPDHGKMMHMFLIREDTFDAFAHIHPVPVEEHRYAVTVPPLPAGKYRYYADVTHESGLVQTLTDVIELPAPGDGSAAPPAGIEPDPDDSFRLADRQEEKRHSFDDGNVMIWQQESPVRADEETALRFALQTADGEPARLEPYMGMMSHAALRLEDGSVFIHLHPTGTISMAAQQLFAQRDTPESATGGMDHSSMDHSGMDHSMHAGEMVTSVMMPYEFPKPGTYRIWVQVKSGGRVYTGVFDADVEAQEG